jgi:uncharacterized protein DUF6328
MNASREKERKSLSRQGTGQGREEKLELSKAAGHLLEECRMVLPGIQALFGFQMVAVFSQGFSNLTAGLKGLHLAATVLSAIAIALVMTPAAYHRLVEPMAVSEGFIRRSSRLLLASMFPLAASLCADLYVVARAVVDSAWVLALCLAVLALFLALWVLLPERERRAAGDAR